MATYLTITAHDPLIARDGRPFGLGVRMRSLDWLYPSVLAGSLRTMLGNAKNSDFENETIEALKQISISGPLPFWQGRLYIPAPKDILVKEENRKREDLAYAIRPVDLDSDDWKDCDCNLPIGGLLPAMLPESVKGEFKPAKIPSLWSMEMIKKWLINAKGDCFESPPDPDMNAGNSNFLDLFLNLPQKESRTHVKIDKDLGVAKDTQLFETIGLDFSVKDMANGIELAARIENEGNFANDLADVDQFNTIGGERRLARWKSCDTQDAWDFPSELASKFTGNKVRMVLATPAIFSDGWKPGWLKGWPEDEEGKAPDYWPKGLMLKLVSACTERWKPISGWSLEKDRRGPKPIRRLVPAGSVYFFEIEGDMDAATLAKSLWLRSVCDNKQDRRDGFGLALWGIWDFADVKNTKEKE
ncbi:MAG: type III-B CRISPR module-associated Cmr3 family protein [Methanotrichaceae archaeon]